jgi:heme ABC exporter ATP-binding subunit CcmA
MLSLVNISVGYRAGASILSKVTFELNGGPCAICGPNGSGKTTLLRAIAGVLRPLAGSIRVAGVDVYANARGKLGIGYLPHRPSLCPDLTVAENLEYWGRVSGLGGQDLFKCAHLVREQLNLSDLWDRPASQLSRGQRQRVALARTLLHQPRVLILDEPTTGFDFEAQATFAALLGMTGCTILFSTHCVSEIADIASTCLTVANGRVTLHENARDLVAASG